MVVRARVTYILLFSTLIAHVLAVKTKNITESCIHLYEKGVEAYLENRFDACITHFENALQNYRQYTKTLQNCRIKCQQDAELSEPLYPVDIENLLFFERTVKTTLCIVKCKGKYKNIFTHNFINKETEGLFEEKKPYEYLHICYFQNKEYQKAASAAFTYLVSHPDDKIMMANLKQYSLLEGVDMKEVVNYEAKDYVYFYIYGADAYDKKDWNTAAANMENSLTEYLQAEEECRYQCEGPFDQGWYPDFIPSIANHFTFCLKCKQKCREKLSSLNGEKHNDLFPSHYNYLQFAYFKLGQIKAACGAVASYLLFYPADETMMENMEYYKKLPKVNEDYFRPRPEAVRYLQRMMYEKRLLHFIDKEFKFITEPVTQVSTFEDLKYRIIMTENQLRGPSRFVSEGLATSKECKILVNIAKIFAILGDGYQGNKSPLTLMEKFEGLTLNRTNFLVHAGLLEPKYLKFFLTLTENAKTKVEQFFKLEKKLYFTYTHLVCRSALPDSSNNRTDFSHPIHADNCNLLETNFCVKAPPAYTWRDYSAIIYLNNDFEGGEFIFSADLDAMRIQSVIQPKCGRMIAFSSGIENLHGVRAVTKGSRCALGIWFTFDSTHAEKERIISQKLLNSFKNF